ncbi:MAG TPA: ATP-binding protein [Steroidobacteraceae bacterium]|jgi:two-component system nitrogen regulation sensor histidine kinase NtrY|nr:ATP-binding protein [Steroidobacteraceae bacterium]
MGYSRFQIGIALRTAALALTIVAATCLIMQTRWYATIALGVAMVIAQIAGLVRFSTQSGREMARFLEAISFDDTSLGYSGLMGDSAHSELGSAMTGVLAKLRSVRSEREEQSRYLQTLIAHVPVALVSTDERGHVQLLNMAARRLFRTALTETGQFARHGEAFAVGMDSIRPGSTAILRMVRPPGALLLKVAVTDLALGGIRYRLISLQNIESEMSAQEMAAWQTVIRVMAHEVMNSLTPVSSLAATAHDLVSGVIKQLPAEDPSAVSLMNASEALETVARRSQGLLHFVQKHLRLTKHLVTQIEVAPVQRIFARLQRLLANDLAARDIQLTTSVTPETLEIAADIELLDQALINLVRNAIEALRDTAAGRIALSGQRDSDGRVAIAVADNGPGIAPDQRDKIFVPFFTTKRQGSGVGLTLVRQIATAHDATVDVSDTPGGGATVSLRF